MDRYATFVNAPKFILGIINLRCKIYVEKIIMIMNQNRRYTILIWRGLVYFEDFHFVFRVIDSKGKIWYNDGKSMAHISVIDGTLKSIYNNDLWNRGMKVLVVVIYAKG